MDDDGWPVAGVPTGARGAMVAVIEASERAPCMPVVGSGP